jgi:thiol-disulfide isomerase/thioredoxin
MLKRRSRTYHLAHLILGLSLLVVLLPCDGLADPYVWPAWRAVTANGKEFHSRELDGKVVVMTMWASWCPSCRKQLPVMDKLQQFYRSDNVQVLSFSFDHSERTHKKFVKDHDLKLPSIFARTGDGLKVVKLLQKGAGTLEAVPTVLIYDKKGRLAHRLVGFFNLKQLEDLIAPLLKE